MTATMLVSREHIQIVDGATGPKAQIFGSRSRVKDIVIWHEQHKLAVAEIVTRFPQSQRGDVYAALAYY